MISQIFSIYNFLIRRNTCFSYFNFNLHEYCLIPVVEFLVEIKKLEKKIHFSLSFKSISHTLLNYTLIWMLLVGCCFWTLVKFIFFFSFLLICLAMNFSYSTVIFLYHKVLWPNFLPVIYASLRWILKTLSDLMFETSTILALFVQNYYQLFKQMHLTFIYFLLKYRLHTFWKVCKFLSFPIFYIPFQYAALYWLPTANLDITIYYILNYLALFGWIFHYSSVSFRLDLIEVLEEYVLPLTYLYYIEHIYASGVKFHNKHIMEFRFNKDTTYVYTYLYPLKWIEPSYVGTHKNLSKVSSEEVPLVLKHHHLRKHLPHSAFHLTNFETTLNEKK